MHPSMREYDLVVIGSGPGGHKAAIAAAELGKAVAAIEHDRMLGGVCANTGTIPRGCSGAARISLAVHLQKRQAVGQTLPDRAAIRVGCGKAAGVSLFRAVSYDNSDDDDDDSRATRRLHLHDNGTRIAPGGTIGLCLRTTGSFSSASHPPRRS
jgi:succinate dehydrogenase/fumarate reductase flavoprotein subunit